MATLLSKTCLPVDIAQDISHMANTTWVREQPQRWNTEILEHLSDLWMNVANTTERDLIKYRRVLWLCKRLIDGDEDHLSENTRWNLEAWISHTEPVAQNMWYEDRRLLKDIDHVIQLDGKRQWFKAVNKAILDVIMPDPPQTVIVGSNSDGYKTIERREYSRRFGNCKTVLKLLAEGCDWGLVYENRHDRIEESTRVHILGWAQQLCRTIEEQRNTGIGGMWNEEIPVLCRIYEMATRNDVTFRMFAHHAVYPPDYKVTAIVGMGTYMARRELIYDEELTQLCGLNAFVNIRDEIERYY